MNLSDGIALARKRALELGQWQYLTSATCEEWAFVEMYNPHAINLVCINEEGDLDSVFSTLSSEQIDSIVRFESVVH